MFLRIAGMNILTDPVWATAIGVQFMGKQFGKPRIRNSPILLPDLPKIDYVLVLYCYFVSNFLKISHNHADHLDYDSVSKLHDLYNPCFLVPSVHFFVHTT